MTDYIEEIEEQDDDTGQLYEHLRIVVDKGQVPVRIDRFMTERLQHSSRNRIQKAADSGFVHVNERPVKSNYKVRPGDVITLMLDRPHHDTTIEAEEIPLDVVYEDEALMVINKPAGMVVHPGAGNFNGTLINAVAWHLRNMPSFDANDPEVGLVHRIDKEIQADFWWWRRRPKPSESWVCSSSTKPLTAAITPWCGPISQKTRDA